jgi:mxaJ protein
MRNFPRAARLLAVPLLTLSATASAPAQRATVAERELRVCADPNNLPFSNAKREGFENRIAELLASDMHAHLTYVWWAQRRGFVRNTMNAGLCDVFIGVPSTFERTRPTIPYYRSTYMFVTRADGPRVASFDDAILRKVRIGVQIIGDDYANTPPAHALANRGIVKNQVGFTLYGDYSKPNPPARIMEAVARGDVDVAVVWGPLAGYFAKREGAPLRIVPVSPQIDLPYLPFVFDISMGVRRGQDALREELNGFITRRSGEIGKILDEYGVPRVGYGATGGRAS